MNNLDELKNLTILFADDDEIFLASIKKRRNEKNSLHVTVSIGISLFSKDGETTEMLCQKADKAMYQAKKSGGNTFAFFE